MGLPELIRDVLERMPEADVTEVKKICEDQILYFGRLPTVDEIIKYLRKIKR